MRSWHCNQYQNSSVDATIISRSYTTKPSWLLLLQTTNWIWLRREQNPHGHGRAPVHTQSIRPASASLAHGYTRTANCLYSAVLYLKGKQVSKYPHLEVKALAHGSQPTFSRPPPAAPPRRCVGTVRGVAPVSRGCASARMAGAHYPAVGLHLHPFLATRRPRPPRVLVIYDSLVTPLQGAPFWVFSLCHVPFSVGIGSLLVRPFGVTYCVVILHCTRSLASSQFKGRQEPPPPPAPLPAKAGQGLPPLLGWVKK
jgi:hypothetical protein